MTNSSFFHWIFVQKKKKKHTQIRMQMQTMRGFVDNISYCIREIDRQEKQKTISFSNLKAKIGDKNKDQKKAKSIIHPFDTIRRLIGLEILLFFFCRPFSSLFFLHYLFNQP